MNAIRQFDSDIRALAQAAQPMLGHIGSRQITYRTAAHWREGLWLSFAAEAQAGETIPLHTAAGPGSAEVKGWDSVSGLVLLAGPGASASLDLHPALAPELGQLLVQAAFASADGPELALGLVRIARPRYYQTDIQAYPGFAGSLSVSAAGEFLGLWAQTGRANHSWLLPAPLALRRAEALLQTPLLKPAKLGLNLEAIALDQENPSNGPGHGLLVRSTAADSPARQSGLLQGDILLEINERKLQSMAILYDELSYTLPGQSISLTWIRGGQQMQVSLVL